MGMTTNLNRRVLDRISMYPSKNSLVGYRATHKVDQNLVTFMLLSNLSQVGVADYSKAEYGGGTQEQMVDVENPRRRFVSISSLAKLTSSRNMGNSVERDKVIAGNLIQQIRHFDSGVNDSHAYLNRECIPGR
jgi:ribosomal protein S7